MGQWWYSWLHHAASPASAATAIATAAATEAAAPGAGLCLLEYRAFWLEYTALLLEYRALLLEYWTPLIENEKRGALQSAATTTLLLILHFYYSYSDTITTVPLFLSCSNCNWSLSCRRTNCIQPKEPEILSQKARV